MCQSASMIVTKGPKACWSPYTDQHVGIRKYHKLPDNIGRRAVNVQVEIVPPLMKGRESYFGCPDFSVPLEKWIFKVDQEGGPHLPEWWDEEEAEAECRIELSKWFEARIRRSGTFVGGESIAALLALEEGQYADIDMRSGSSINQVMPGCKIRTIDEGANVKLALENSSIQYCCGSISLAMGRVDTVSTTGNIGRIGSRGSVRFCDGRVREVGRDAYIGEVGATGSCDICCGHIGTVSGYAKLVETGSVDCVEQTGVVILEEDFATRESILAKPGGTIVDRSLFGETGEIHTRTFLKETRYIPALVKAKYGQKRADGHVR